jgi:hypothetical protein
MISVADLLDRARARGSIISDYQLAKVIGITHQGMTNYRSGKTMPDARVLEQICALSGDDVAVVMAQIQAQRERTPEGKTMWLMVAKRLAGGASTAILSVVFTIGLIAGYAPDARAGGHPVIETAKLNSLYIVQSTFLSVPGFLRVRLRAWAALCWCFSRVCP